MSESIEPKSIREINGIELAGCFQLAILTHHELLTGVFSPKKQDLIVSALQANRDPRETMHEHAEKGMSLQFIPLTAIHTVIWHSDDAALYVRYARDGKPKGTAEVLFPDASSRNSFAESLKQSLGECKESTQAAGFLHTASNQLIYGGTAFFVCALLASGAYYQEGPSTSGRARNRAMAELIMQIGPVWMLLIGVGIFAANMIWWYVTNRNVQKFVVKRLPAGK